MMNTKSSRKRGNLIRSIAALFVVGSLFTSLGTPTVFAGNTWDGDAGTGLWNTPANWDLDTAPTAGVGLTFAGNVQNSTTNDLAAVDPIFAGILFTNDGAAGNTNAFTLAGSRITLGGDITTTANTAGTTITDIISLNMVLDGNRTITTNQLSNTVLHNLTISGIISETGGARNLVKAGSANSILTLSGANTYTGKTIVTGGILSFNTIANVGFASSALGAPTTVANGTIDAAGTLLYTGGAASTDRVLNTTGAVTFTHNGAASTLTLNGNITGSAGVFFRANANNKNFTVNGVISTAGAIGKTDDFTLTLSNAANSFSGPLEASKGVISINSIADAGSNSAAGAGSFIRIGQNGFPNQGTLRFTAASGGSSNRAIQIQSHTSAVGGVIENTISGQLLTLSGLVTMTPTVAGAAGPLTLTGAGNGLLSGVVGGLTATPATAQQLTITKSGGGTWTLSNNNIYTGTTTINQGTLSINSIGNVGGGASAIGNPSSAANGRILMGATTTTGILLYTGGAASTDRTIQINSTVSTETGGATITNNGMGPLTFTAGTFNNAYTNANSVTRRLTLSGTNGGEIQGIIQNNSALNLVGLTKGGTGTWTLSGPNTYSGGTIIGNNTANVGTLNITHGSALGTGGVTIVSNSGSGNFATLTLNSGTGISVANNFTTSGEGQGGNGIVRNVTGNNTISGTITLTGGGGGTRIQSDGGSLTLSNTIAPDTTLRVLFLSGSADGTVSGAINDGSGANTLAGLTKQGNGTWTLTNTNNYTGPTTVSAGRLVINGNQSTATGTVTVASAGTLAGNGTIGGAVVVNGKLAPGNSPDFQTYNAGITFNANSTFEAEILGASVGNGTIGYDSAVVSAGNVVIDTSTILSLPTPGGSGYTLGSNLWIIDNDGAGTLTGNFAGLLDGTQVAALDGLGGYNWKIFYGADQVTNALSGGNDVVLNAFQAIPEPSTLVFGGLALLGFAGAGLRRRRMSVK